LIFQQAFLERFSVPVAEPVEALALRQAQ